MGITIIPHLTTTQRDAIPAFIRVIGLRIFNISTNIDERWNGSAWVPVASGGGSFTPLDHIAAPADNDAARQAFLIALRSDMLTKGLMLSAPTFAVSGVITGSVVAGVALQLVGAQTYNATSDAGGNFTFPAVENGSYTLTPTISGHWFSPGSRSVTVSGANVPAQNFTANAVVASQEMSPDDFLVFGNNTARSLTRSGVTQESSTFPGLNSLVYGVCFHAGRYFIPALSQNSILVYEKISGVYTLKATLNTNTLFGVANPMRVYSNGARLFVTNNSGLARFFTYNTGTEAATALGGAAINYGVSMLDAAMNNNKVYIVSNFGGTPSRNLTVIDFDTFAVTTFNVAAFTGATINFISAGSDALLVGNTSTFRVLDADTLATRGSAVTLTPIGARIPFSNDGFFVSEQARMIRIDKNNATVMTINGLIPNPGQLSGAIANDLRIYVADATNVRIYMISSGTLSQIAVSAPLTGVTSPAYLKN